MHNHITVTDTQPYSDVSEQEKNALEIPLPDLQVKSITERGLWKYEALQEVVWLPETFSFSLLVSILPDKIDIS